MYSSNDIVWRLVRSEVRCAWYIQGKGREGKGSVVVGVGVALVAR